MGQSCEPYIPAQSKCDTFLTGMTVYIPPSVTQADIQESVVYPQAKLLGAFIPRTCRSSGIQMLCISSFAPCTPVNDTFLVLTYPCYDLCNVMVQSCNATFSSLGKESLLPICAILPNNNCYNATSLTDPVYTQIDCPYPLKIDENANQEREDTSSLCVYPCPSPQYSDGEWNGGWVMSYVIGFISFFTGLFMIVTWILSPLKRKFPSNVILWFAIACTGIDSIFVWAVLWGGTHKIVCTDDDPPQWVSMPDAEPHDAGCIIQGIALLFFGLAANLWWLGICLHLFEVIVLKWRYVKLFYRFYHILAWGYPLLAVIIALAAEQISTSASQGYCFAADLQSGHDKYNGYLYGLYFGPSFLCLFIGTTVIFITLAKLIKWKLKMRDHSSITIWHFVRLLGLVAVYWWLLLWIDINGIYGSASFDDLQAAIEDQVRCSATTGTECPLEERFNYGVWWLNMFNVASVGSAVFICVGTTQETFSFWWRFGKALFSSTNPSVWWLNVKEELTLVPGSDKRSTSKGGGAGNTSMTGGEKSADGGQSDDEILHSAIEEGAL